MFATEEFYICVAVTFLCRYLASKGSTCSQNLLQRCHTVYNFHHCQLVKQMFRRVWSSGFILIGVASSLASFQNYTSTHTDTHTHKHTRLHTHTQTRTHTHKNARTLTHTHTQTHTHSFVIVQDRLWFLDWFSCLSFLCHHANVVTHCQNGN